MELFSNNQKWHCGNTTVYAIALVLVVGFVGTALIKMGHHDVLGGVDYYQSTRARVAAKAGLQKFEHYIDNLPDSIVAVMQKMIIDTVGSWWILGDGSTYETLANNSSFRVQAVDVDPENFILRVQSEGRAGSSRATINAMYQLGNLDIYREPSVDQDFALYVGDVSSMLMIGPIDIDGNTRMSSNVNLDANASGSRFRGTFRTSDDNTSYQTWQGTYTFDDLAYFGSGIDVNGMTHLIFNDLSAFEERPKGVNSGTDTITFRNDTYFNKNGTGGIDFFMNHHNIHHTSAFNFNSGTWHDTATQFLSPENPMDLEDSVGLSKNICMPELDLSVIPSASILNWSTLANPPYLGGSSSVLTGAYDYAPGWNEIDGTMANNIWSYAASNNLLWKGFVVVEVDQQCIVSAGGTFANKIIFVVPNGGTLQASGSGSMFQTTSTAHLTFYTQPGGALQNIGHWTYARGYIYVDSGATLAMGGSSATFDPFVGAIHVQDNASMSWYPTISGVPTISYDAEVIEDLRQDDFLTFPCAAGSTSTTVDSIIFVDGFTIDERLLGIVY